jgi:SAM-dependent methyltransferase
MYTDSASTYDAIYRAQHKDYAAEAAKVAECVQRFKNTPGKRLLDVGCGTGIHAAILRSEFEVEGLDISEEMLAIARQNYPDIRFHHGSMVDFKLDHRFDVIVCLFSAIGYVETLPLLNQAVRSMAEHLNPGGVLIVEPWFAPGIIQSGGIYASFVDEPDLKVARMNVGRVEGNVSYLDFHYLVATPRGVEHFTEQHALGLFTDEEYLHSFRLAGLEVVHDQEGLDGRGLYIGIKAVKR